MCKEIRIKYVRDVDKVVPIKGGDWIDLRVAEDVTLTKGDFRYVPLGVAIQLPTGYEAIVAPRSSLFKNFGVIQANSIGIIDESYCGDNDEWHFPCYAVRNTFIPKNTRICQFRIIEHQPSVTLITVEALGNRDRGGLGSTGTNELPSESKFIEQHIMNRFLKVE